MAHSSQLYAVPEGLSDEDAVTVEPVACAVHAVLGAPIADGDVVAVVGAGTLGLLVTAALTHLVGLGRCPTPAVVLVGARYAHQQRLARELGCTEALPPDQLGRAVRRHSRSLSYGGASGVTATLSGGADVVIDCVGSPESIAQSLAMVRPRGTVALVGMPGKVTVDLAPLVAPRGPPRRRLRLRDRAQRREWTTPSRPSRWPSTWPRRSRPGGWSRPPTLWPASRTPSPTQAPPAAAGPSRSHSTYGKDRSDESPSRLRPRGGQLDATDPVLERRGLRPRDAARGQPCHLRPRAHEGDRGPLPRHPPRAAPPRGRPRPVAGAPAAGHEADHLLRRRLAARCRRWRHPTSARW